MNKPVVKRDAAVIVRAMTAGDHVSVIAIAAGLPAWFTPTGQQTLRQDLSRQPGLVAEYRGQVCGFLTMYDDAEGVAHIGWLGVSRDAHRRGIGRALVQRFERDMRAAGMKTLEVWTLGDSVKYEPYDGTRAFYRAMGFQDFKREKHDNPECPESLTLRKPLTPERSQS